MASTYSTNLKIELIASGSQAGTWGDTTNVNLGTALEEAITGRAAVEFVSDDNLTLTVVDLNTTQPFRNLLLDVTSVVSLTASRDLIVPTITKQYVVWNNTTGGQAITVRTTAGTGVSVPNGARAHLFVDGTDVKHAITSVNGSVAPPNDVLAALAATQTLTNKTIDLDDNTLTGTLAQFNAALSNGSFASLGGAETLTNKTIDLDDNTLTGTLAQFNAALSAGSFASLDGAETLTNKTIDLDDNTLTGTLAQFNAALSNGSFASLGGAETLTNKTLTAPAISDPTGIDADDIGYDNTASGLTAENVQAAIDEVAALSPSGYFAKSDRDSVAWEKTGNATAKVGQTIFVEVGGEVLTIAADTTITMPSLTAGTDYAIWVAPDGTVEADDSFSVAPTAGGRRVGGFHYAPGGRATLALNAGDGGTTAQIMETSFYDLKWRPSVLDPRGLVLVGDGAFWAGAYLMSANHLTGPVHKFGVNPCRNGNPPQNLNGSGNFPNASPANILEALQYHGFRAPNFWEFQLLAFGVNEERSIGGSGPGDTGDVTDRDKHQQTSAWGVFDATGVLLHWGNDTILTTTDQTLPNPSRGDRFRYSHFVFFGGSWASGAFSGSRFVFATAATTSSSTGGSRGVCDHLILD